MQIEHVKFLDNRVSVFPPAKHNNRAHWQIKLLKRVLFWNIQQMRLERVKEWELAQQQAEILEVLLPKLWQRCNDQLLWFCGEETSCVVLPTYCWRMSQWEVEIYWAHRWSLWLKANMCSPLSRHCRSLSARQIFFSEKLSDKFYERISCSPKKLSAHQNLLKHTASLERVYVFRMKFSVLIFSEMSEIECEVAVWVFPRMSRRRREHLRMRKSFSQTPVPHCANKSMSCRVLCCLERLCQVKSWNCSFIQFSLICKHVVWLLCATCDMFLS